MVDNTKPATERGVQTATFSQINNPDRFDVDKDRGEHPPQVTSWLDSDWLWVLALLLVWMLSYE